MKYGHPLDTALADRNMFSWFGPAFGLLASHWLVAVVAGVATCLLQWLVAQFPWPYLMALAPWWLRVLHAFLNYALVTLVAVVAYRAIAHREGLRYRVGDINPLGRAASCAVQVSVVWLICGLIVLFAGYLLARGLIAMFAGSASSGQGAMMGLIILSIYGIPLVLFLLSPLWFLFGIAVALSHAHAARSPESGLSAVINSLRLVFGQKWRVIGPAYAFGAAFALLIFLQMKYSIMPRGNAGPWFTLFLLVASAAYGLVFTFVIERVYAPDLGVQAVEDDGLVHLAPTPASPVPVPSPSTQTTGVPVAPHPAPAPAAPPPAGPAIAAAIEEELRISRTTELADLAERGLAADARFFADHPENTVALAKRLVQAQKPDLALRVLQPFVREQQAHRLHLTGALLAAELLARAPNQLSAAAKFLAQLKALYPNEPMIDRLARITDKALAQAQSGAPQPPGV